MYSRKRMLFSKINRHILSINVNLQTDVAQIPFRIKYNEVKCHCALCCSSVYWRCCFGMHLAVWLCVVSASFTE